MQLRDYQIQADFDVRTAWHQGHRNVMLVLPTGAGKTLTKTHIALQMDLVTICIAHRQELVGQISLSLAQAGIYHNIVAPVGVIRFCAAMHVKKLGVSFYAPGAKFAVAGVDTLIRRTDELSQFISRVRLWDIDEGHHVVPGNKWAKAVDLFPHALGLGVTATPLRSDRKGLDGIFDFMVLGPSLRETINRGYLSEYRIFCPPQSIDLAKVETGTTGDFKPKQLSQASEKSTIVGDVVDHYLKIAPGKRGITFAVDVKSAEHIAAAYNAAGVPASVVSAKTPDNVRTTLLEQLETGQMKQLVNVDLFGEGMDCPALEVISMARPTQSYGLYVQQFGRVLRLFDGKTHGIVIDHVGNVVRHGLPDAPRQWSLAAPEGTRNSKSDDDTIGLTACNECFKPYERHLTACPYCGAVPVISERGTPEHVDGNLVELDPETLAQMRGEVHRVDGGPLIPHGASDIVARAISNRWRDRQEAQHVLRETMSAWAGVFMYGHGESDLEIQKRFYLRFGVDVLGAQALNAKDADLLTNRVREALI